ncbi:MAG: DUF4203 domain-containing protein [Microcoleaceae cyanobacterium]
MIKVVILAIFSVLFGGLFCFGGYRLLMVMLPIWAFFGGLWLGTKGVYFLLGEGFIATTTGLTTGVVLGVFSAIFSWQFYEIGVALLSGAAGAWLISGFLMANGIESGQLIALMAVIVGVVTRILTRVRNWQQYWVIVFTALSGANAMVLSVLLLIGHVSLDNLQGAEDVIRPILQDSWFWRMVWSVLAITGMVTQLRNYRQLTFVKEEFVKYWS